MLTAEMIRFLLDELSWDIVLEPTTEFPYRVQRVGRGYKQGLAGTIQAGLSMMLEVQARKVPDGG